jgi:hypothetical protein
VYHLTPWPDVALQHAWIGVGVLDAWAPRLSGASALEGRGLWSSETASRWRRVTRDPWRWTIEVPFHPSRAIAGATRVLAAYGVAVRTHRVALVPQAGPAGLPIEPALSAFSDCVRRACATEHVLRGSGRPTWHPIQAPALWQCLGAALRTAKQQRTPEAPAMEDLWRTLLQEAGLTAAVRDAMEEWA